MWERGQILMNEHKKSWNNVFGFLGRESLLGAIGEMVTTCGSKCTALYVLFVFLVYQCLTKNSELKTKANPGPKLCLGFKGQNEN